MKSDTIVLATRNQGKVREFSMLLTPFSLKVIGLDAYPGLPEVEETGTTFSENALLKACTVSRTTGLAAIADDSGLEVDALGKAPGVYSARYSATDTEPATDARNNIKLLHALQGIPAAQRTGRFRCCMAVCTPEGEQRIAEGAWEGIIGDAPRGDNGFGYDPLFFDPELGRTAAEMSREEKNTRSHRARAVAKLLEVWPQFWADYLKKQA